MDEIAFQKLMKREGLEQETEKIMAAPASILNTLLLHVFHKKTKSLLPGQVLKAYRENRFTAPSSAPFFTLQRLKYDLLSSAAATGFEPLELSPLCPLGACSVVGPTHQNNVVSALRGTEVVADATNVLALESAVRRPNSNVVQLCAAHRHVRAQPVEFKGFTPHFDIFCMTTAGRDTGNFEFEKAALSQHLSFYMEWCRTLPETRDLRMVVTPFSEVALQFCREWLPTIPGQPKLEIKPQEDRNDYYYRFLRIKIWLTIRNKAFEIGDCGFTDWTARLLTNRKERFFISGLGIELISKAIEGMLD